MPEIPEYVGYANDLVEKVGARLEQTLRDTVAEMATKSDLALVEERAKHDRDELAEARKDIGKLRDEIKADKAEAIAKGRRIWRGLWTAMGIAAGALLPSLFTLMTTHQ